MRALNSVFDVCDTVCACVRPLPTNAPTLCLAALVVAHRNSRVVVWCCVVVVVCVCCLSSPSVNCFGRMACLSSMGWLAPVVTLVVSVTCAPLATWRMTLQAGVKLTMLLFVFWALSGCALMLFSVGTACGMLSCTVCNRDDDECAECAGDAEPPMFFLCPSPVSPAAAGSSETDPSFPRVAVGDIVVRGPDWDAEDHGSTDGGPGGKGTVITVTEYLSSRNRGVHVQWAASGVTNLYRWGYEGKFDVKVFSSPSGEQQTAEKASGFTVSGVIGASSVESAVEASSSGTSGDSSEAPRTVAVAVTSASVEWANSVPESEVCCRCPVID